MNGGLGLSGCSAISKVKSVAQSVETNRKTMNSFTSKIQDGEAKPFQATYVTTGDNPTTVVYAVQPPKGLSFTNTPSSTSSAGTGGAAVPNIDIIVNSTGEYSCTPPDTSGSAGKGTWACQMLSASDAQEQNAIFDFYTPAHWVNFLKGFSLAGWIRRRQGHVVDDDRERVRDVVRRLLNAWGGRREHDLHHGSGHPRLRQGRGRHHEF